MKLISSFFRIPVIDNFIRLKLIPYFIWLYLHIVHKTSKVIYFNKKYYDDLANENIRHTFAVWHGRQFTSLYLHRNKGIIVLVSPSRDGNVQAAFLELFGFGVVRGSSDKQPVKSLLELIRISKKKQVDVAFAVDGPKGPIYKVKPGIATFAAKTNYKILPITVDAKYKIHLKTWDNALIPLPFNKIICGYSAPIGVSKDNNYDEIANIVEEKLLELQNQIADELSSTK